MKRLLELTEAPIVGETYLVPCVNVFAEKDFTVQWDQPVSVPVLGEVHNDSDFGNKTTQDHYHIDVRFFTDEDLTKLGFPPRSLDGQYNTRAAAINGEFMKLFKLDMSLYEKEKVCVSELKVGTWYADDRNNILSCLIDKLKKADYKLPDKCARCPHHGTFLAGIQPENGVIKCPAHGMRFDAKKRIPLHKHEACSNEA